MARTRTYIKYTKNVTHDEYSQLDKLNMGWSGLMQRKFRHSYVNRDNSKVVMIKEGGKVLGWAYCFDNELNGDGEEGVGAYFYVHTAERGKGLGSRLMYHVRKIDEKPYIYPWDETSAKLFRKFADTVRYSKYDEYWMVDNDARV